MLSCYTSNGGVPEKCDAIVKDCWISLINPDDNEIAVISDTFGIEQDIVRAALDEEETSRVEQDENYTLIIIDLPFADKSESGQVSYSTLPFGIIVTENNITTVCLKESSVISDIASGKIRNLNTAWRTKFIFQFMLAVAARFLQYLRQVDRISKFVEKQLHKSMKNKELIQLLDLEKSLVFFSTSLKANEVTLEKLLRGRIIKLYDEDEDLLSDVLVEFRQAIEMANIYSSILSGTMDAFASVISNNLNIVMKVLTVITIIMTIPNIIFSFYGMNIGAGEGIPGSHMWWIPLAVSACVMGVIGFVLYKKGMF